MNRLVFVTGGARSGKSGFAMRLAGETGGQLVYVATAIAGDDEMASRIKRHREERGCVWRTVEEPHDVAGMVSLFAGPGYTVLVDCLTMWLMNLMTKEGENFERAAVEEVHALAGAVKSSEATVIVVSNEVGMGIVPDNSLSRKFRDAAGGVNRIMAEASDEAYLMVSGVPVKIK